jgi:hypothetical protein
MYSSVLLYCWSHLAANREVSRSAIHLEPKSRRVPTDDLIDQISLKQVTANCCDVVNTVSGNHKLT